MTQLGQCGNKQSGKQTNGLTASFFRLRLPFPAFSPNQKLAQPTFCRVWPARGWHTVVFCFFCFFCFFWFSYVFLQFLKLSTLAALVFLVFAHETKKTKETKVDNFKNCKNALENQKKPKKNKKNKTLVRATPWPVTLDKNLVVQVFGLGPTLGLCYIMCWFLCKIRWIYNWYDAVSLKV